MAFKLSVQRVRSIDSASYRGLSRYFCSLGKKHPTDPNETCVKTILPNGTETGFVCSKPFLETRIFKVCEELELTEEEGKFMVQKITDRAQAIEKKVKEWNTEIQPLEDSNEYWNRKEHFLSMLFSSLEETFANVLESFVPQSLPPEFLYYGKDCPECGELNMWAFTAESDLEIKPRKILESCPKCGLPGSKYVDGRGYLYFQHYIEGKRKVCYIGKAES